MWDYDGRVQPYTVGHSTLVVSNLVPMHARVFMPRLRLSRRIIPAYTSRNEILCPNGCVVPLLVLLLPVAPVLFAYRIRSYPPMYCDLLGQNVSLISRIPVEQRSPHPSACDDGCGHCGPLRFESPRMV